MRIFNELTDVVVREANLINYLFVFVFFKYFVTVQSQTPLYEIRNKCFFQWSVVAKSWGIER